MQYTVTKMTVNQAVLILENRIKCNKEEKEEAKQMAIKALKQVYMLQDIKKEIELKEKTLTDKYGQVKYGVWTDDICNVFDKYIEKYSNT